MEERKMVIGLENIHLNSKGNVDYEASNDTTSGQFDYRKYYGFINLQVKGNQLKQRNIFIRPPLDIESMDLNKDSTVSIDELDKFGFTSSRDYVINTTTKMATPVKKSEDDNINEFDYTKGTERTFTADQTADDNSGNLSGLYFGLPTKTTIIGNNTVLYQVIGSNGELIQNQLTTLPNNNTRVRTAQGFGLTPTFGSDGKTTYASYYRETKFEDDLDNKGNVIKSAKDKFLEKFYELRELNKVSDENKTKHVEDFFNTDIENK